MYSTIERDISTRRKLGVVDILVQLQSECTIESAAAAAEESFISKFRAARGHNHTESRSGRDTTGEGDRRRRHHKTPQDKAAEANLETEARA